VEDTLISMLGENFSVELVGREGGRCSRTSSFPLCLPSFSLPVMSPSGMLVQDSGVEVMAPWLLQC